jgi:hypothetical protein
MDPDAEDLLPSIFAEEDNPDNAMMDNTHISAMFTFDIIIFWTNIDRDRNQKSEISMLLSEKGDIKSE